MLLRSSDEVTRIFYDALNYCDGSLDTVEPAFVPFTASFPSLFQGVRSSEYIPTLDQASFHSLGVLDAVGVYDLVPVYVVPGPGNTYVTPPGYPGAGTYGISVATSPYRRSYGGAVYMEFLVPPGTVFNLTAGNFYSVGQVRRCALFSLSSGRLLPLPVDTMYYGYCQPSAGFFSGDNNSADVSETVFTFFYSGFNLLFSRLYGISPRAFSTTSNYVGHRVVSSVPHLFHLPLVAHAAVSPPLNSIPVSILFTGYRARLFSSRPGDGLVTFFST